jgi:transmembrane sensor
MWQTWKEKRRQRAITDTAAYWVCRLHGDRDITEAEREALNRWLDADPEHDRAFRNTNIMVMLVRDLPLRPVPRHRKATHVLQFRWLAPACAVVVALAVAIGWFVVRPSTSSPKTLATGVGEMRTIAFDDGSVARLNTRTRLQWFADAQDRRAVLLEGEVLFDVVPDPKRPFRVAIDDSEVRVLGTRFNVYRKTSSDEVRVTVFEGSVEVRRYERSCVRTASTNDCAPAWQTKLGSNQQVVYRTQGTAPHVRAIAASQAIKWPEGVLEIQDEPLPNVVAELARYTDRQIIARDVRLQQLRVGGTLSIRDVRDALINIENSAPVSVTERGNTFLLDYRAHDGADNNPIGDR